jgi:glutamyl-tRNA reductase
MTAGTRAAAPLPLAVVGADFRRAPARRRGGLVLADAERHDLAVELRRSGVADGLACLDTCNRTEWIASSSQPAWAAEVLRTQMIARYQGTPHRPEDTSELVPFAFHGAEAARHLFDVAVGLESFVFGEQEIAAQLHRALERCRAEHTASPIINGLGRVVGRLTKLTHRVALTGSGPRGVHDLAVDYALRHVGPQPRVAVVGLGQIGEKVTRALRRAGLHPRLCNRSLVIGWVGDEPVVPLTALPELLGQVDVALICTGAAQPVVTADTLPPHADGSLLLVDLGIPGQVACLPPEAARVADLEALQAQSAREVEASWADVVEVRQRVNDAVDEFTDFCRERELALFLRATQERHERYVTVEVPKLLDESGLDPQARARLETRLKGLIRRYTNAVFKDIRQLIRDEEDQP